MTAATRLRVDPIACDGRGLCAETLPEMITLDDWGFPKFLDAVEKELGTPLRRVTPDRFEVPDPADRWAHVGFHPQKQKGKFYLGVVLPVGRLTRG